MFWKVFSKVPAPLSNTLDGDICQVYVLPRPSKDALASCASSIYVAFTVYIIGISFFRWGNMSRNIIYLRSQLGGGRAGPGLLAAALAALQGALA